MQSAFICPNCQSENVHAPPQMKETFWGWVIFFVIVAIIFSDDNGFLFWGSLCAAVATFIETLKNKNYNDKIFPIKYNIWLHSYFCHRYGHIYVVM